ncbi:hypothetical protein GQ457_14G025500 [Hibiscus cannabinus]
MNVIVAVAKRSSMFNDPIVEMKELTALINTDITDLDAALSDWQTLQNMEISDGHYSEDRVVHSTTVCDDLKNKLMGATKHFQDVLTARTENIKAHENRKHMFSNSTTRENPFQRRTKSVTEPPPASLVKLFKCLRELAAFRVSTRSLCHALEILMNIGIRSQYGWYCPVFMFRGPDQVDNIVR